MNRKNLLMNALAITIIALLATGCNKKNIVKGTLSKPLKDDVEQVFLFDVLSGKDLDSCKLENGQYIFEYTLPQSDKNLYAICFKDPNGKKIQDFYFVPEKGTVTLDSVDFTPSGTPLNDQYSVYKKALYAPTHRDQPQATAEQAFDKSKDFFLKQKEHPIAMEALLICHQTCDNPTEIKELMNQAGSVLKEMKEYKELEKIVSAQEATQTGNKFLDIEGIMLNSQKNEGDPVKLSDIAGKGQYVLVDFWASWCAPCRREIKETLKPVYEKYRNKGLAVVGISVSDSKENQLKAIKALDVPWPVIFDAETKGANDYGITGIPHIMLIGPDGTILARGLYGNEVEEIIAPLYK